MSGPELRAAGTYVVRPGFAAARDALARHGRQPDVREALATVVLIEIEVVGAPGRPELGQWHQQDVDQVPWDEVYTSLDRSVVIARMFAAPAGGDFAVSFFLHCFDPSKRLETPWGPVALSAAQAQRPEHLKDRKYVYPS